jgi:hypothetical protein
MMLTVLLFVACSKPAPEPPPPPVEGPKVNTLLGESAGVVFTGYWTSTGCEGRTYARNLYIQEDQAYAGLDLVSPCPPNARCAWSGITAYAGIWQQQGDKVMLREIGAPKEAGSAHPTEITANAQGQLVENGCAYSKGTTVPEGYTEDQVKPKLPGSQ